MIAFKSRLWRALTVPVFLSGLCLLLVFSTAVAASPSREVRELEKQLKDRDSRVRARAAWDLGRLGAVESLPALTLALEDPSGAVRANAAASIGKLGEASKPAIPALRRNLDDPYPAAVGQAAGALKRLGVPVADLVPAYRRLLTLPSCRARVIGLKGLIDEVPPTELFEHAWECAQAPGLEADTRREAREALRRIVDRRDRILVPQILETLKTVGGRDGSDLTLALGSIRPPVKEAVPVLMALIDAINENTQRGAIRALGRMGPAAMAAGPRLAACLQTHWDAETREMAAEALGQIGPGAAQLAVPALTQAARADKWPKVRQASLTALGEMGPAAREAIPALREALKNPDSGVSLAARNALFRLDPSSSEKSAALHDQTRPVQKGSLFEDLSELQSVLPGKVPEAFELIIYDRFALVTAPHFDSRNGRARFSYQGGVVTGPQDVTGLQDCGRKIALAGVDFARVPRLIRQAPELLGTPSGKVTHVILGGGVFCKPIGWYVFVDKAGFVEFNLDGRVEKVQKP